MYGCTKRLTPLESSDGHHLPTRAASARAARGRCFDPKRAATTPGAPAGSCAVVQLAACVVGALRATRVVSPVTVALRATYAGPFVDALVCSAEHPQYVQATRVPSIFCIFFSATSTAFMKRVNRQQRNHHQFSLPARELRKRFDKKNTAFFVKMAFIFGQLRVFLLYIYNMA